MDEHKHNYCKDCAHGLCGGSHGALRWIIGAIIMLLVFWMGMRIGEIRSEMYGYGNYGRHMRIYPGYAPQMMYYGGSVTTPPAPTTVQ
jgi:hypothetical protein